MFSKKPDEPAAVSAWIWCLVAGIIFIAGNLATGWIDPYAIMNLGR